MSIQTLFFAWTTVAEKPNGRASRFRPVSGTHMDPAVSTTLTAFVFMIPVLSDRRLVPAETAGGHIPVVDSQSGSTVDGRVCRISKQTRRVNAVRLPQRRNEGRNRSLTKVLRTRPRRIKPPAASQREFAHQARETTRAHTANPVVPCRRIALGYVLALATSP